jgi:hypothetical protein
MIEKSSKKSSARLGKRAEPSVEELEFIYEQLVKGKNPRQIMEEYEDTSFNLRGIEFLEKRSKEYRVARNIFIKYDAGAYDSYTAESKHRHQVRLLNTAETLLSELKEYFPYASEDDCTIGEMALDSGQDEFFRFLYDNFLIDCLFSHAKPEIEELKELSHWHELEIKNITSSLIGKLARMVEKGEFKGKCEICHEWNLQKMADNQKVR